MLPTSTSSQDDDLPLHPIRMADVDESDLQPAKAETTRYPADQSGIGPAVHKRYQRIGMELRTRVLALHAEGVQGQEIARITGLHASRVSEITRTLGDLKAQVQQVLNTHRVKAAEAWGRAIPKAAKKGDHRPARELLIATGDVSPLYSAGSGVTVVVNMPGSEPVQGAKVVGSASTLDNAFVMPSPQVVEP